MEYIEIDVDLVPYRFEIALENETYTFEIEYNSVGDFFTMNLLKNDVVIVQGDKVVYGKPLFSSVTYRDVPNIKIIPLDKSGQCERVTFENFGKDVKLYLVGD